MIANTNPATPAFSTRLDRTIVSIRGKSSRHLVIDVTAPAVAQAVERPRLPLDLGIVIDASGSMAGERLAAAKAAALGLIEALGPRDHLSIVSFADEALTHLAATRMDEAGKAAARRAVEPLSTRGHTNLDAGWKAGAMHLAKRKAAWVKPAVRVARGVLAKYAKLVHSASEGAVTG